MLLSQHFRGNLVPRSFKLPVRVGQWCTSSLAYVRRCLAVRCQEFIALLAGRASHSKPIGIVVRLLHRFTCPPRLSGNDQHYQICLVCGTAYEYDWKRMRRTDLSWSRRTGKTRSCWRELDCREQRDSAARDARLRQSNAFRTNHAFFSPPRSRVNPTCARRIEAK